MIIAGQEITPKLPTTSFAEFVCFDIETGDAPEAEIKKAIARWKPNPRTKDPKKIETQRTEAALKIRDKAALLDSSPILCVANKTDSQSIIFNGMSGDYKIKDTAVISAINERNMLVNYREWLNDICAPETVFVGFNIRGFDLPKIRAAYVRHRLKLPEALDPKPMEEKNPVLDVMLLFLRYFTMERRGQLMVGFAEVMERLGLDSHKEVISGAMVPQYYREGKIKEILSYCMLDTVQTWNAFRLMTSRLKGME